MIYILDTNICIYLLDGNKKMNEHLYLLPVLLENSGFLFEAEVVKDFLYKKKNLEKLNEVQSRILGKKIYYGARLPVKAATGDYWFDIYSFSLFMYIESGNFSYWLAMSPLRAINILEGGDPCAIIHFNAFEEIKESMSSLQYNVWTPDIFQTIIHNCEYNLWDFSNYKEWVEDGYEYKVIIDNKMTIEKKTSVGSEWSAILEYEDVVEEFCARLSFEDKNYELEISNEKFHQRLSAVTDYLLAVSEK